MKTISTRGKRIVRLSFPAVLCEEKKGRAQLLVLNPYAIKTQERQEISLWLPQQHFNLIPRVDKAAQSAEFITPSSLIPLMNFLKSAQYFDGSDWCKCTILSGRGTWGTPSPSWPGVRWGSVRGRRGREWRRETTSGRWWVDFTTESSEFSPLFRLCWRQSWEQLTSLLSLEL